MEIILVLIPVSLIIVTIAVSAFLWAVDNGQYDDMERAGDATLFDDPAAATPHDESQKPTAT